MQWVYWSKWNLPDWVWITVFTLSHSWMDPSCTPLGSRERLIMVLEVQKFWKFEICNELWQTSVTFGVMMISNLNFWSKAGPDGSCQCSHIRPACTTPGVGLAQAAVWMAPLITEHWVAQAEAVIWVLRNSLALYVTSRKLQWFRSKHTPSPQKQQQLASSWLLGYIKVWKSLNRVRSGKYKNKT